jgi:hypothetical protein
MVPVIWLDISVEQARLLGLALGAVRRLSPADPAVVGPDWLDDALVLVERAARRLDGRVAVPCVRAASLVVDGRHGVRGHPALFVLALSATFGLTIAAAEALAEGGGGSPVSIARLIALFATIGAAGMGRSWWSLGATCASCGQPTPTLRPPGAT